MKKLVLFLFLLSPFWLFSTKITNDFKVEPLKKILLLVPTKCKITITGHQKDTISSQLEGDFPKNSNLLYFVQNKDGNYGLTLQKNLNQTLFWTLLIPKTYDLSLTMEKGSIEVKNINGSVDIESKNSHIKLSSLKTGKKIVNIFTRQGNITLSDSQTNALLATNRGNVFVNNLQGNPIVNAKGGTVIFRDVFTRNQVIFIRNIGGKVDISSASQGADIINTGGDIIINNANNFIVAKAIPGNITINSLKGWIRAKTSGGDIKVRIKESLLWKKNDVSLVSLAGDITLTLPDFFSMYYVAEIQGLQTINQSYFVYNDFKFKENQMQKSRQDRGELHGAKNQVQLTTSYGNIYIKKEN